MSDPAEDPPLVSRVEPGVENSPAPVSPPDPAFRGFLAILEACGWAALFVAAQMFAAIVAVVVVFLIFVAQAPNAKAFVDAQLEGVGKALDPKATGEKPPVPPEIGESLAWGMLAAQAGSLALIAVVIPRRVGRDWKRQLSVRKPHPLHILLVVLVAPGFMIGADAIQSALTWATGVQPQPMTGMLKGVFGTFPWPLTLLAVAVGPGVVEEFWCRGLIGSRLSARLGLAAGVAVTSVLFAVMHLSPALLLVYTAMGAYLHFVYVATRSIWPPILLHAANNGLAVLAEVALSPDQMKDFPPLVGYITALSLLLFASVALWTSRAELEPAMRKDEAWWESDGWKPEYPGVSAPPVGANVRLAYAVVSPAALIFAVLSFVVLVYLAVRFLI